MAIYFSHILGIVCVSASRAIRKKRLTLECSVFSYLSRTIGNHFPHFSGTILLMWRLINFFFRFHFHLYIYVKLFTKEVNPCCSWAQSSFCISDPFATEVSKYLQYRSVDSFFYVSASVWVIFLWIWQLELV